MPVPHGDYATAWATLCALDPLASAREDVGVAAVGQRRGSSLHALHVGRVVLHTNAVEVGRARRRFSSRAGCSPPSCPRPAPMPRSLARSTRCAGAREGQQEVVCANCVHAAVVVLDTPAVPVMPNPESGAATLGEAREVRLVGVDRVGRPARPSAMLRRPGRDRR